MFNKRVKEKREETEEERRCALCVYARTGGGSCFCVKKNKETDEDGACGSYEYDLLKRRPAPFPRFGDFHPEGGR